MGGVSSSLDVEVGQGRQAAVIVGGSLQESRKLAVACLSADTAARAPGNLSTFVGLTGRINRNKMNRNLDLLICGGIESIESPDLQKYVIVCREKQGLWRHRQRWDVACHSF